MTTKDMLTWDCTLIPIIQYFYIGMGTLARILSIVHISAALYLNSHEDGAGDVNDIRITTITF